MHDFPTIRLADIALHELKPFRIRLVHRRSGDHCRWILRGSLRRQPGTFFYKIWNPCYVRRDNVPRALEAGFYDEQIVPALHALIVHNGLCRGYVMHEGITGHDRPIEALREVLQRKTSEAGYFLVQFTRHHTMLHNGLLSLLDLEGVYPLAELPAQRGVFEDLAYGRFVAELYERSSIAASIPRSTAGMEHAGSRSNTTDERYPRSFRKRHPLLVKFCVRPTRRIGFKLRNLVPKIQLIEY